MKQDRILRVGIIGTGWIAEKAAITLNGLKECKAYAVGSRTREKAEAFAQQWSIAKAYGSYDELTNGPDRTYVETIPVPQQITGYEYQFLACRQALIDGLLEPREMPHEETLYIMQLMDSLRRKWGVRYPMD